MTDHPVPHGERREGQDLPRRLKQLSPASPEPDYESLAAYAFARRYVGGKTVADVGWGEIGRGSRLLAGTAARVVGITRSPEAADLASAVYPAPNAGYETAKLPALPHPKGSFDVVVALGVVENLAQPDDFLREAWRVLRRDGVVVISIPDKAYDARRRGGMYAPEAEESLKRHFGNVRLYRHGAVAGGFVGPYFAETTNADVQGFRSSAVDPTPSTGRPAARSILAVCGGAEAPEGEPFLLLDDDRRVFEEHEDLARDVGLMWEEVDRMQETEAQCFQDTLKLFKSEVSYLRARVRRSEALARQAEARRSEALARQAEARRSEESTRRSEAQQSEARYSEAQQSEESARRSEALAKKRNRQLEEKIRQIEEKNRQLESHAARLQERVRGMENSVSWRVFEPYRQLRARIDAARGPRPKDRKGDRR